MSNLDLAKAFFIEALEHIQKEEYDAAESRLRSSLDLVPERVSTLTNLSAVLIKLKKYTEASQVLEIIFSIDKSVAPAWLNSGLIEKESRLDNRKAIDFFDRAIEINPDYPEAWLNKGVALVALGRHQDAIHAYDQAIALKPDYADAHLNRGSALLDLKQHQGAIESYDAAIALNNACEFALGIRLHAKMQICDWHATGDQLRQIVAGIERGLKVAPPFATLALTDSLALQEKSARIWAQDKFQPGLAPPKTRRRHDKIRIGYFSADYHEHATAYLMAELFEKHDKSKFELTAFSFGPDKNDGMRQRIVAAFDRFLDVRSRSDMDVALLARDLEIDIAVDLKGFTYDSRPGIFALRAAPVQVSYLGYPGTMGAHYIDYLIADPMLIPETSRQHYSEKIACLPNSYQVNDAKRQISDKAFTREEMGLPETSFVFCCFNNNYKITPRTFDGWMRILTQVPRSVLWLLEDNPLAPLNLKKEAGQRGVSPDRLVFAKRLALPEHLARHRLADLFLDTLPYNAHTTASDALWAGLPVLTCAGEAFASRVAASLLNAIHLSELITSTQEQYESLAIELASNPGRLLAIKQKLTRNRLVAPLFDTRLFARHIEAAYTQMHERCQAGLGPDHIDVAP